MDSQLIILILAISFLFIIPFVIIISFIKYVAKIFARAFFKEYYNLEHTFLSHKLQNK